MVRCGSSQGARKLAWREIDWINPAQRKAEEGKRKEENPDRWVRVVSEREERETEAVGWALAGKGKCQKGKGRKRKPFGSGKFLF